MKTTLPVAGMHCASCAMVITKTFKKVPGVASVDVNYATEEATIEYDPQVVTPTQLSSRIEPLGYRLIEQGETSGHQAPNKEQEQQSQRQQVEFVMPITLLIFLLMMWEIAANVWTWFPRFFIMHELYQVILLILATIVQFWVGRDFVHAVGTFIRHRVANMDTLIGIGTMTAYVYSVIIVLIPAARNRLQLPDMTFFDVTIVVIGFIVFGKYLEVRSKKKTGEAIAKLIGLQAKTALVLRGGREIEIPLEQVVVGDTIIVKPGGKIPVDGTIKDGATAIDESMVTGESMPVDKGVGDAVIGGTMNAQGSFSYIATKVGADTVLAHIIALVKSAQGSRAPIQRLADRISSVFVPVVLVIAFVSLLTWLIIGPQFMPTADAVSLGILCFVSILVIACPCALGLATPTAIIVGVGKGAMKGILIKNAESLQKLHSITTIVMDKTGTLTVGKPSVTDILPEVGHSETEILRVAVSLEKKSEHPLAEAFVRRAYEASIEEGVVEHFEGVPGKGVRGTIDGISYALGSPRYAEEQGVVLNHLKLRAMTSEGKTPVVVFSGRSLMGIVGVADTIKDTAPATVKRLQSMGITVVMLTGDDKETAKAIAAQVGITDIVANVLPQDKAARVKELQSQGQRVAMVGDGVNDAPALAQSDVGIAMGTGTDVAIESADVTILKGEIERIPRAIRLSRRTMRTIRQNLFWAFIYNVVGIPLAAGLLYPAFGLLLSPVFAGLAMALSSVSVVSNSLRLKALKL